MGPKTHVKKTLSDALVLGRIDENPAGGGGMVLAADVAGGDESLLSDAATRSPALRAEVLAGG